MEPGIASAAREAAVVDANIALGALLELPYSERCAGLFENWLVTRTSLYAPVLWGYEVVSGLRKAVALKAVPSARANEALEQLYQLGVATVAPDPALHRAALRWADRLGHLVSYDAQYLALAERLGAVFWTADRKLAAGARAAGADWVRAIRADD
jgi:predicted nucleic acid-binding protein